jgi:hypothetical protein
MEKKVRINDFDDILEHVGGWGKYQMVLLLVSLPFAMLLAYGGYTPVLFLYTPVHYCTLTGNASTDSLFTHSRHSLDEYADFDTQCFMYNDEVNGKNLYTSSIKDVQFIYLTSQAVNLKWCLASMAGPMKPRASSPVLWQRWDALKPWGISGNKLIITLQMDWVCDDAWIGPFTQAMFFVGSAIGALIFGWVGDKYGRYPSLVISTVIVTIAGVTLPYCEDIVSFTIVRFIMGLSYTTYYITIYLLCK